MKYIITGATGHLGNVVTRKLLEKGEDVKIVIRDEKQLEIFGKKNIDYVVGDIRDVEFLRSVIEKDSIVIHMAGIITIVSKNKQIVKDTNILGTKNICDVCLEKGVKRLVYTSSVHALPVLPVGQTIGEQEGFDYKVKGLYAGTKLQATKYVKSMTEKGLDVVVCYPSGIIGPYDYKPSQIGELIKMIIRGKKMAVVKGGYNFVDVRDVADAVIKASVNGKSGSGYILSGHNISVEQLFKTLNKILKKPNKLPHIPMWLAKLFAKPAELYFRAKNIQPIYTPYSLYTITSNDKFDNSKSKKELDFKPRPVEQSFSDAIDFFQKHEGRPSIEFKNYFNY